MNEFGAERWVANVEDYIRDEINLFEQHGWNYAAWQWQPAWEPLTWGDMSLNFRFGPDPENVAEVENDLITTYHEAWSRNLVRPSTFGD